MTQGQTPLWPRWRPLSSVWLSRSSNPSEFAQFSHSYDYHTCVNLLWFTHLRARVGRIQYFCMKSPPCQVQSTSNSTGLSELHTLLLANSKETGSDPVMNALPLVLPQWEKGYCIISSHLDSACQNSYLQCVIVKQRFVWSIQTKHQTPDSWVKKQAVGCPV